MSHLQHTSPGSTHKVSSRGSPRSLYWIPLSWQARRSSGSCLWSLFTRIHLQDTQQHVLVTQRKVFTHQFLRALLVMKLKRANQDQALKYDQPDQYLYACPLLGFSGYQWPLNFSCRATANLSTNSSTFSDSSFSPLFTSRFRKNTTAAISLLIFTAVSLRPDSFCGEKRTLIRWATAQTKQFEMIRG